MFKKLSYGWNLRVLGVKEETLVKSVNLVADRIRRSKEKNYKFATTIKRLNW